MKTLSQYRFQTAVSVLMLSASSLLAGCGGSESNRDGALDANEAGSAGTPADEGRGASGSGGSATTQGGSAQGGQAGSPHGGDPPINSGEYSVESFGVKDERPADFQPLNDKEAVLVRRDETAIAYGGASLSGLTLDDAGHDFAENEASLGPQLAGLTPIELVSANLDDDGADEIAVIGSTSTGLVLRVIDHAGSKLYASHRDIPVADKGYTVAHLRAGDLDGDGRAELLVSASDGSQAFARVYDDAEAMHAQVKELVSGPGKEIALSLGNFDADRALEVVMLSESASGLRLQTLDDAAHELAPLRSWDGDALPLPGALRARGLAVEAGNFDDDPADELAVFVDGYDTSDDDNWVQGLFAGTLQDSADDEKPITLAQTQLPAPTSPSGDYRKSGDRGWFTQSVDLNGDGRSELVVVERVPNEDGKDYDYGAYRFAFDAPQEVWESSVEYVRLLESVSYTATAGVVNVGQAAGLGRDLLVTVRNDAGPGPTKLQTQRLFAAPRGGGHLLVTKQAEESAREVSDATAVWPVSGDFDGDSLRVRATGKKWLELTRPRPIVILAAPPAQAGVSQVTDNNTTSYGTSRSVEKATTEEYSITRKVTLSFEVSVPGLDFLTAGASASMSKAMSESNTRSLEDSYGMQYAASYPDDVVVFQGVLCMRYEYQILGGADAPLIGTFMTVDVPLDSRVYKWTTDYYNDSLGDAGSPIDDSVLPQVAGDPTSFPTVAQRDKLIGTARKPGVTNTWKSDPISVGQGQGVNAVWIDLNETETSERSFTTSTEYGASAGAFVTAEYSQGVDETAAYSVSVTRGTEFQGAVGDITDEEDYADWFFSFGLFVYPTTLAKGERVQVVNYWTEGFGPGYSR